MTRVAVSGVSVVPGSASWVMEELGKYQREHLYEGTDQHNRIQLEFFTDVCHIVLAGPSASEDEYKLVPYLDSLRISYSKVFTPSAIALLHSIAQQWCDLRNAQLQTEPVPHVQVVIE